MNKAGRPRKALDKVLVTLCVTIMPSHRRWLIDKAAELSIQQGHEISASAVVRAVIRHANDNPPAEWNLE